MQSAASIMIHAQPSTLMMSKYSKKLEVVASSITHYQHGVLQPFNRSIETDWYIILLPV